MSRYKENRKATNRDEMYKETFDRKGVKSLIQFRAKKLKQLDEDTKQRIKFEPYIWKYGDTFQLLASKYYSDPKMWWVIASFNNKPTESHIELGETIKIPTSLSEVMQVI
jgi:nucleoid-associated protein YgaU